SWWVQLLTAREMVGSVWTKIAFGALLSVWQASMGFCDLAFCMPEVDLPSKSLFFATPNLVFVHDPLNYINGSAVCTTLESG
ncbi:MAG: hypothetical protein RSD45_00180, partial [Gordonibacter sp.]